MKTQFFLDALQILSPLFLALLGWVAVHVAALIRAKTKNELVGGMLLRLSDSVFTLVKEAEQTAVAAVKAAKDPASPGGVELTKEEGEQIKNTVLGNLKNLWGTKGLKELGTILGLDDAAIVDKFLVSKIESTVNTVKAAAPAVSPPPVPQNPTSTPALSSHR